MVYHGKEHMEVKQIAVNEVIPYEKNAKLHPPEQVEWIANSIKEFGFKQPLETE